MVTFFNWGLTYSVKTINYPGSSSPSIDKGHLNSNRHRYVLNCMHRDVTSVLFSTGFGSQKSTCILLYFKSLKKFKINNLICFREPTKHNSVTKGPQRKKGWETLSSGQEKNPKNVSHWYLFRDYLIIYSIYDISIRCHIPFT